MSNNNLRNKITICCAIFLWTVGAQASTLPPDPNNAALLYYQSFLFCPKPDAYTRESIYKVLSGTKPDQKVRKYLNLQNCRKTIKLIEVAAQIPVCNWGIPYSQGLGVRLPQAVQLNSLSRLLAVDARTLATDGNYRAALERCLMMRRFARHVGDDAILLYASSITVDRNALSCIQLLLGYMKPDIETLTWLKNQLSIESGASTSPARALMLDFELAVQSLRMNADILENTRQAMLKKEQIKALARERLAQNTGDAKEVQSLKDEDLISLARKPYADFLNSALQVMDSGMPYEEKYAEIKRLTDELEKEFGGDPAAKIMMLAHPEKMLTLSIVMACADQVLKLYNVHVRHTAHLNSLKAALEIYLVRAKTGQLPEKLPDGLPKDPYSGKDFEYEITDEGFALRCQGEDFQKGRMRQMLEFKVKSRD
jgi:hypothetical protein